MRILVLNANPRKDGYTQHCADLFISGLKKADTFIDCVDLCTSGILPCRGCFHCWSVKPGICRMNDPMRDILEKFLEADILVCISPLYAYCVSSYLKIFMERTLPLLAPSVTVSARGYDRNSNRFPSRGPKKMAAIIVGGLKDPASSNGAVESLRLYAEGFGMEFVGALLRHESYIIQFEDTKPLTIKTIETAFVQAGSELVTTGSISIDLQEKVSLPLAPDCKTFALYSGIYWEYGEKFSFHGGNMDLVKDATNHDIRILMNEMTKAFDPKAAPSLKATISYQFTEPDYTYTQTIGNGKCIIDTSSNPDADLVIACTSRVWAGIIRREIEPAKALHDKELIVKGNRMLFLKLGRIFPPPGY